MGAYGPGMSQGSGDNVFREEEKRYQLHREQQMRMRHGRLHGGKLVERPTDLSALIDVLASAGDQGGGPHPALVEHEVQLSLPHLLDASHPAQTSVDGPTEPPCSHLHPPTQPPTPLSHDGPGSSTAKCYTLPAHPGFILLPSALSPELQLRLMREALLEYPEPPANTNHTLRYGHLPGLWAASQAGLSLAVDLGIDGPAGAAKRAASAAASLAEDATQRTAQDEAGDAQAPPLAQQAATGPADPSKQPFLPPSPHACAPTPAPLTNPTASASTPSPPAPAAAAPPSPWAAGGPGFSATRMLHKLRWATLGPQFNWTERTYEGMGPYRPLPPVLRDIAVAVAAAVQHLWVPFRPSLPSEPAEHEPRMRQERGAEEAQGELGPRQQQQQQPQQQQQQEEGHSGQDGGIAFAQARHTGHERQQPMALRPFLPDAAIVNYYRHGDTLGGHLDDVEPDMDQPIVSLSLGCEAVLLVGGRERDVRPTALRLRSGDVVVLAGEARRCYHGVPRIFAGSSGVRPEAVGKELRSVVQYMQESRINISIRAVGS